MNELNTYLSQFAQPERVALFERILAQRTRYITICLEDIFQSQNASAALRTCEAFGVQDVHIIEDKNDYRLNPMVVKGSAKWLNLYKYNSRPNPSAKALDKLKKDGYRIVATSPHGNATPLEKLDLKKGKTAVVFGTEYTGISQTVIDAADELLTIPMFGFVESFNISASVAIVLQQLTLELRKSEIAWQLSRHEQDEIMLQWLKQSITSADEIIERYNKTHNIK